jgi:type IV pilus assembly protein PilC
MSPLERQKFLIMVKIGEEVSQLDVFFERLGTQYAADLEHKTSLMNTFLEPILVIFLGLVVGLILITMYLPMFQISTNLVVQ